MFGQDYVPFSTDLYAYTRRLKYYELAGICLNTIYIHVVFDFGTLTWVRQVMWIAWTNHNSFSKVEVTHQEHGKHYINTA